MKKNEPGCAPDDDHTEIAAMIITGLAPAEAFERATVAAAKATENLVRIRSDSVVSLIGHPTTPALKQFLHNIAPEKRLMHMQQLAEPEARSHIVITAKRSPESIVRLVRQFARDDALSPKEAGPFTSGTAKADRGVTTVSTDGAGVYHFEVRNGAERVWGRVIHDDGQLTTGESKRGPKTVTPGTLESAPSTYGRHHLIGGVYTGPEFASISGRMQNMRDAQSRTVLELAATTGREECSEINSRNAWFGGKNTLKDRLVQSLLSHSDLNDPQYLLGLRNYEAEHVEQPTIRYRDCFTEAAGAEALARERAQTYLRAKPAASLSNE